MCATLSLSPHLSVDTGLLPSLGCCGYCYTDWTWVCKYLFKSLLLVLLDKYSVRLGCITEFQAEWIRHQKFIFVHSEDWNQVWGIGDSLPRYSLACRWHRRPLSHCPYMAWFKKSFVFDVVVYLFVFCPYAFVIVHLVSCVRLFMAAHRLPCPSSYLPVCSNSLPLNWWYHPMISSSVKPLFTSQPVFWCHIIKIIIKSEVLPLLPVFFQEFYSFSSLIHFELIFYIYCVRWECSLLHSHVSCFPQHHLWKLSFSSLDDLGILVKNYFKCLFLSFYSFCLWFCLYASIRSFKLL